jgi:regulator of protease activity HflC (stomatin/prohibitin superfamily)
MPGVTELLLLVVPLAVALSALRIAAERERFVVFRLGRFARIAGPGIVFLLPFVDRGVRVDLDRAVPGWQGLRPAQLAERLQDYVFQPRPPA